MEITKTDIYCYNISIPPFTIATGTMSLAENIFIRVHTDEGLYGVGECSPLPYVTGENQATCFAVAKEFASFLKGKNPLNIEERVNELHSLIAGNTTIKSAFDMAFYDLAAKSEGQPLYKFLGGEKRLVETDITIGIDDPKEMSRQAKKLQEKGASVIKVKIGTKPEDDIRRIEAIVAAVGPELPLRIDANQGWTFEEACTALDAFEGMNIQFCEQPMRSWDDEYLPALRERTEIKIIVDESCYNYHDAHTLIRNDACDYINIKFAKASGISGARQIHSMAVKSNITCMLGVMLESRLGLSANLHFIYASPGIKFFDIDSFLVSHLEDPVINGISYDGYKADIDDIPGIGADVDDQFLEDCEYVSV
jgi:L-alanine-DL-glutamate epimerase-like enolase superfamily enzyme